jgi:hypothetical protein
MKLIKIEMELVIDWKYNPEYATNDKEVIADYLNKKLYEHPSFFGDFGPENITVIDDNFGVDK